MTKLLLVTSNYVLFNAIRGSSGILNVHRTVKILVCLTAAAFVIFNWRLTNLY